eukprot:488-Chlamydomonas_euryale.AAC.1
MLHTRRQQPLQFVRVPKHHAAELGASHELAAGLVLRGARRVQRRASGKLPAGLVVRGEEGVSKGPACRWSV